MTSGSFCSCWTLSNLALIFTSLSPQSHEKGSKKTKPPEQITGFPLLNTSLFGWPLWPLYSLCVSVWVKVCVLCAAHSPFWKLRLWAANEKKDTCLVFECCQTVYVRVCVCVTCGSLSEVYTEVTVSRMDSVCGYFYSVYRRRGVATFPITL